MKVVRTFLFINYDEKKIFVDKREDCMFKPISWYVWLCMVMYYTCTMDLKLFLIENDCTHLFCPFV